MIKYIKSWYEWRKTSDDDLFYFYLRLHTYYNMPRVENNVRYEVGRRGLTL